jgi:hypothetical protein
VDSISAAGVDDSTAASSESETEEISEEHVLRDKVSLFSSRLASFLSRELPVLFGVDTPIINSRKRARSHCDGEPRKRPRMSAVVSPSFPPTPATSLLQQAQQRKPQEHRQANNNAKDDLREGVLAAVFAPDFEDKISSAIRFAQTHISFSGLSMVFHNLL